jgi:hypothetical protein
MWQNGHLRWKNTSAAGNTRAHDAQNSPIGRARWLFFTTVEYTQKVMILKDNDDAFRLQSFGNAQ